MFPSAALSAVAAAVSRAPTQRASLNCAQMSLDDFAASGGEVKHLEKARDKAMEALSQGHTLDLKARFSAGVIALAAGYVGNSKVKKAAEFWLERAIFQATWFQPVGARKMY